MSDSLLKKELLAPVQTAQAAYLMHKRPVGGLYQATGGTKMVAAAGAAISG